MRSILAWLSVTLFFSYQYMLRVMPNVMLDDIITQFKISPGLIGQISGFYYVAYVLMHIPIGILLDHIGPKKIVPICVIIAVAGNLPLAYSDSWILLAVGRILVAIGSSAGVLGTFKIIKTLFPAEKFTLMFGISAMFAVFGATYGGQPIAYLLLNLGLKNTINIIVAFGVMIAITTYFSISHKDETIIHESIIDDLKLLFSYKKWIIISLIGGLMIGPVEGFADGWASKFFAVSYPLLSREMVSFLPSLLFLGFAFGSSVTGFIASKTGAYYSMMISCALIMCVGFVSILYFNLSIATIMFLLILIGVASSYQTIVIYLASTFTPNGISGITVSCANMVMMIFGYFFHVIISGFINAENLNDKFTLVNALSVIPCALAVAVVALFLFIKFQKQDRNLRR